MNEDWSISATGNLLQLKRKYYDDWDIAKRAKMLYVI